jgi:dephospho-CoA kinase
MLIFGLTGSIGMGKSTTAGFFREAGVPVHDADATVHRLYRGEATPLIEEAFPGSTSDGVVDRGKLARFVVGNSAATRRLEAIVHPLVRREEAAFLARAAGQGAAVVVLDVPLLLETRGERRCDVVVVASAAPEVQRARVLSRPGMSEDKFAALLAKQMPDEEKRKRAHVVIDTGRGFDSARRQVEDALRAFAGRAGRR